MTSQLPEQEVVLKLVNMSPEEIAALPPNERASVLQLVRTILLLGLRDKLTSIFPARVVRYPLATSCSYL